jgi:hypothetical protein
VGDSKSPGEGHPFEQSIGIDPRCVPGYALIDDCASRIVVTTFQVGWYL